jgi:ABC-type transport system involved in multi-copper enzyme maturation permease subunit
MRIALARRNFRGLGHFEKGENMNPLVKKEIRLLLPGWLAVLLLEAVQPWFWNDPDYAFQIVPVILFFGLIILAVDSFGREFSLGTFQSLLAQPVARRQIWRTKITVLLFAAALIFAVYFASCELLFHQALKMNSWNLNPAMFAGELHNATFGGGVAMLVALAGGLWTTLLIRQIAASFWITFLAPAGLLMLVIFFLPSKYEAAFVPLIYGAAGIYIVAGFWFAHRLFHRAQDAAWTGGVIAFSKWRYFESGSQSSVSARHRRPFSALVKKELQLQSITFFCAAALMVLHLAVIIMRKVHGSFVRDSLAATASEFFWTFWLVMPLIVGCMMVAEERRLGVMASQFCLPASRRLQFALKFFPALIFGMVLGGFMPLVLEKFAAAIGAPNPDFNPSIQNNEFYPVIMLFVALPLGLSLAGFFASTLAKNFLQALGAAVVITVGFVLFMYFAEFGSRSFRGITWWNPTLNIGLTILTVLVLAPWLAYRNFNDFQERGRIWRRNVFGLVGAILLIFIGSAALYNRAWEVFEPAEPPHGSAKLSLANPPTLQGSYYGSLRVQLPDGRVWFDSIGNPESGRLENFLSPFIFPFPISIGPQKFMAGSNWVSTTGQYIDTWVQSSNASQSYDKHIAGYTESVGIQSDGTLWVSDKSDPKMWTADKLTRLGDGTNWRQAAQSGGFASVLLLKKDGTLWRLGTNHFEWRDWPEKWLGLRAFTPYQIGTNSDWNEIGSDGGFLAQKNNGGVWRIEHNGTNFQDRLVPDTNYDQVPLQKISMAYASDLGAYVSKNGTLWFFYHLIDRDHTNKFVIRQVGRQMNWVSVALSWDRMTALKSDGTLWQWENLQGWYPDKFPPTRLGIHDDWVAVTGVQGDVISLAADGSLWLWPNPDNYAYSQLLLKIPKQPKFLGNIFKKPD